MIIGLTGGIGSGKSTVAAIFSVLGVPVYEADAASRDLIDTDLDVQQQLRGLLGDDIVKMGRIDRPLMASRSFNEQRLMAQTNAIIHPAVARDFQQWYERHNNNHYVIREAAILFESGSYRDCEKVVVVTAPVEMRIERVMKRNRISRQQVLERMENQWPEDKKISRADYVIYNDLTQSVIKQVLSIHEDINRQANQGS
jgi:dephospho-CoA kinase